MERRKFIKIGAIGGAALHFPNLLGINYDKVQYDMPRREFGNSGEKLSIVGFGGIVLRNNGQEFANRLISEAHENGINYYDVAPGYGDAQDLMGPALEPYRKNAFLACKTHRRNKKEAEEELHDSLKKLRTDYFDLYQFHAIKTLEEVETIFGADGAMETFLKARKEGKIKHIGFSAHDEEAALRAMELFDFDSILYPINCVCWENGNFGPKVFNTAKEKDVAVLALKAVARTRRQNGDRKYPNMWYLPFEDEKLMENAFRFTLSKDLTATVHAGDEKFFGKTIEYARSRKTILPPDEQELSSMLEGVEPIFSYKNA